MPGGWLAGLRRRLPPVTLLISIGLLVAFVYRSHLHIWLHAHEMESEEERICKECTGKVQNPAYHHTHGLNAKLQSLCGPAIKSSAGLFCAVPPSFLTSISAS